MKKLFYTFYISIFIIICFTGYLYKYQSINEIIGLLVFLGLVVLDISIHGLLTRRFKKEKSGAILVSRDRVIGRLFSK